MPTQHQLYGMLVWDTWAMHPSPVCFVSLIFPAREWKSTRAMPAELASTFASHLPAQIKLQHLLLS
jgi:hypothetical protein